MNAEFSYNKMLLFKVQFHGFLSRPGKCWNSALIGPWLHPSSFTFITDGPTMLWCYRVIVIKISTGKWDIGLLECSPAPERGVRMVSSYKIQYETQKWTTSLCLHVTCGSLEQFLATDIVWYQNASQKLATYAYTNFKNSIAKPGTMYLWNKVLILR